MYYIGQIWSNSRQRVTMIAIRSCDVATVPSFTLFLLSVLNHSEILYISTIFTLFLRLISPLSNCSHISPSLPHKFMVILSIIIIFTDTHTLQSPFSVTFIYLCLG